MFAREHYVPVLRWKRGEQQALANLDGSEKDGLTPLVEVPPDDFLPEDSQTPGNLAVRLPRLSAALEMARGTRRAFVDFGLLRDGVVMIHGAEPISRFFDLLDGGGVVAVPVTGLVRRQTYQTAVRAIARRIGEIALRLTREDLARPMLHDEVNGFLALLELSYENVHLLVDIGLVGENRPSLLTICKRVPSVTRWLTFTVLSGSFPRDLSHLGVGAHLLPRYEWRHWRTQVFSKNTGLPRVPTFGDYTTQHAIYYIPPPGANVSASIRYTIDDDYFVLRGEGLRSEGSPGYSQYPAIAEILCDRKEFQGPDFSYGDRYIWQIGSRAIEKTGSPETWLRAAINHHLTFVIRQLTGSTVVATS